MSATAAGGGPRRHIVRVFAIWLVLSAVVVPLVIWVLGPQLPPGSMSDQAHAQTQDNIVMTATVAPIVLFVLVFFGYALFGFRRERTAADGPPDKGNTRTIAFWLAATVTTVMFLAAWGSYELFPGEAGAGGGSGPHPIFKPPDASSALPVQVIGQQWQWTFRFPTYGGVETPKLALPVDQLVALHVTSLDVTHSFWAIQLAVKADAVPGTDNVAYVRAKKTGTFTVRCAELCGLWHGHMYTHGLVLSRSDFSSWITKAQKKYAPATGFLKPLKPFYFPQPLRRAG